MLTISRDAVSQPDAEECRRALRCLPCPPAIPFSEELRGAAGFDHSIHGKDCEKHIYFGNAQPYIYTFTHIYLHAFFSLGCIYVYLLSRFGNNFPSIFIVSSYELSTKPSLIWILGSQSQPPLQTKALGSGKPARPIHLDQPFSKGPLSPLETLPSMPLLASLL